MRDRSRRPRYRRRQGNRRWSFAGPLLAAVALLLVTACSVHSPLVERTRRMEERLETVQLAAPGPPAPAKEPAGRAAEGGKPADREAEEPPRR